MVAETLIRPKAHCPVVEITVVGIAVVGTATAARQIQRVSCSTHQWKLGFLHGGQLSGTVTVSAEAYAYLHAKFCLDPSNRLATVHEASQIADRQDRQTDNGPIA